MVDFASFVATFPEFKQVDPNVVNAHIARAARWVDPRVWTTLTDDGVTYLAAHFLAISVFGSNVKLVPRDGKTTYYAQYDEMRLSVAGGFLSAGGRRW